MAASGRYQEPATGEIAETLEKISPAAFSLIRIVELERSEIRDGRWHWYGCDALGEMVSEIAELGERPRKQPSSAAA